MFNMVKSYTKVVYCNCCLTIKRQSRQQISSTVKLPVEAGSLIQARCHLMTIKDVMATISTK